VIFWGCRHPEDDSRLLELLPYAAQAAFNSANKQHDPLCLQNTRVDILKEIRAWADGQDERCIFWLNGLAGTGKSTIARTIAREYYTQERLGASFFFSRDDGDVNCASKFFTTIAVQLAGKSSSLKRQIYKAIAEDNDIASKALRDQWSHLIFRPLSNLDGSSLQPPLILVIDALDECEGDNDVQAILQLLSDVKDFTTHRVRIFITSRPEMPINFRFRAMPGILHRGLVLDNVSRAIVDHDISVFFGDQFREIRNAFEYLPDDWPGDENMALLVSKAEGLFIYAATVCRFIKTNELWHPQDLLALFIPSSAGNQSRNMKRRTPRKSPTGELDKLYIQILERPLKGVEDAQDREDLAAEFKQVIGTLAILSEPLSVNAVGNLLSVDEGTISLKLRSLRSVLKVPEDNGSPIRLLHASFPDFLLDKQRCCNQYFWVDEKEAHSSLVESCIQLMSTSLGRDICSLHAPGTLARELDRSLIEQYLPSELQYACRYWVQHFQKSNIQLHDDGLIPVFLRDHLLHWLEVLSLMGKISEGVLAITSLESHIPVSHITIYEGFWLIHT
jgi:hypothetical protein